MTNPKRLSREREKEISKTNWDAYSGEACCEPIAELLSELDALRAELNEARESAIDEIIAHGCLTGDCPHSTQQECDIAVFHYLLTLKQERSPQ